MYYKLIENAFSSHYSDDLLAQVSAQTFEKAKVDIYGDKKSLEHIRNNMRLEFVDKSLARDIHTLIQSLEDFPFVLANESYLYPSSEFRSYLYEPGQYFKPHRDGASMENNHRSKITCLIYLNDTQGGETVLMPEGYAQKQSHIKIQPSKGTVLLFEHKIWHEGTPVLSGQKYVIRTNLMYSNKGI